MASRIRPGWSVGLSEPIAMAAPSRFRNAPRSFAPRSPRACLPVVTPSDAQRSRKARSGDPLEKKSRARGRGGGESLERGLEADARGVGGLLGRGWRNEPGLG